MATHHLRRWTDWARPRPDRGRSGRNGYLLVVVSLLAATVVAVREVAPAPQTRTETDLAGLFSCSTDDGGGEPNELDQFLDGLVESLLTGNNLFTFQGLAPPGVPVEGEGTPDPVTGGTLFTRTIGPAQLGVDRGVDFFDENAVPGAAGDELTFGLELRTAAGANGDDLGIRRLFNQNFGLPDEAGGDIGVTGVDVDFSANQAMTALPSGFRGAFEGVFVFQRPDGTEQAAGFRIELNSLAEGTAVPDQSSLGFALREPEEDPTQTYYALGQTAEFASFDGSANQPGVGFGLDLAVVEPGPNERDLVAADVAWAAAPRQVAFGFAQLCPTRGHVGWNLDPAGLPDPAAASLDVDFRLGDQLGQTVTVDDGSGGTFEVRASEVVLDGRIDGLPSLMDFIMLEDALSFTRSAEVAPDVTVDRFHLAADDPEREDELPLHTTAQVTDMGRHVLFVAGLAEETGVVERGELTSWTLACPGEPPPPGPPAPDDVRLPDRTDTLPLFPPGCERHSLAPVPSAEVVVQNWLPEDLDAQDATAGLRTPPLDATQFGFVATRDVNPLSSDGLLAFGARINGLERATVDLTEAPDTAGRARVYVQRGPAPAADDGARFVVDVAPEVAGANGTRVTADAMIDDLPDAVRVDYQSIPGRTPLDITWRADAPFAVSGGTFDARFPGAGGFELRGAFETGAVGGGPLPPAAHIQVTRNNSADQRDELHYTAPDAADDGFPSPVVPPFDPAVVARLHVGAELTNTDDRQANLGMRLHADIEVPQPIEVYWEADATEGLRTVAADLCEPGAAAAPCATSRFDVSVVRGPRTDVSPAALLTPPAMPTPTASVSEAVPAFTDFRPGSGARAVVLGADVWGAEAVVQGLARFGYRRAPLDVRVQLANTADQPFRINLLDASQVADAGGGPRPQVVFADAAIDRLPRAIRVRQRDVAADADEPWLWVNTESLGITDIDAVDWTEDPAGSRPRLTGVLRIGDAETLRTDLAFGSRPTAIRDGSLAGADLWADYDLDDQLLALDASLSLDVPRHVALWRPTLRTCDGTDQEAPGCQSRRRYERDEIDELGVRFRTTSAELGDLNLAGGIHRTSQDFDWKARAHIEHVPGTLEASVTVADNLRLPWVTVDLDVDANTSVGSVWVEAFNEFKPIEYREAADADGQCTQPGMPEYPEDPCTANYAVSLTNVPEDFHVTGRVQGEAEERLTPATEEPVDPTEPEVDVGGIGFVHANLDLRGTAERILVEGRDAGDGQIVGTLEALDEAGNPAPVSGFVNARVDHVMVDVPPDAESPPSPFNEFYFGKGGVLGAIWDSPSLGRHLSPLTVALDLVVGFIVSIIFGGDLTTDFEVDVDLPLFVGFDRVDTVRFGMNGTTLSIDERHPDDGDPADPATIAVRQQSLDHEDALRVDGAFFHRREVEFSYDTLLGFDEFDITNDVTDAPGEVGLYRHDLCIIHGETNKCYLHSPDNETSLDIVDSVVRQEEGSTRATSWWTCSSAEPTAST
jgi:hypothetical protein